MKYRLAIPLDKIAFQQWEEIFETLREYDDFGYKILKNDEEPLEDWYGTGILHFAYLISTSENYSIYDEYVLEDKYADSIISGDEKSILSVLAPHFMKALATYRNHLESYDFGVPNMLDNIFEIDEREY